MGKDAGRYTKREDRVEVGDPRRLDSSGWITSISLRDDLTAEQAARVIAHEIGHALEDVVGPERVHVDGIPFGAIPEEGVKRELGQVYHDLNDDSRRGRPTPPRYRTTPEDRGYHGDAARSERIVEAIRAYLTNPNDVKTVAPKMAARIRELVNQHPRLSRIIRFNAVGGLGLLAGHAVGGAGEASPDEM